MAHKKDKLEFLKQIDEIADRLRQAGITDNDQIDFVLLVREACARPKVYVGKESFELAATFLDGYDSALDRESNSTRDWGLKNFGDWLGPLLNHSTSLHWRQMMTLSFPEDATAFSQLPQLYEEFLIDVQTSARKQNLT